MGRASIYRSKDGEEKIKKKYDEILRHWPIEKKQYQLSTRHGSTHVIACGNPKNPPLVLLHGSCGNSLMWLKQVQNYINGHCIYAVDIIGEANHSEPVRPKLKSTAYMEWLEDVFEQLGVNRVSLVGFSLGAWLSLKFAATWPDRVEKLVLLSPSGVVGLRLGFHLKQLFSILFMGPFASPWLLRRLLRNGQDSNQTELTELIARHFKPRRWSLPLTMRKPLPPLYCPVLLMLGGRDSLYSADKIILRIAKQIPQLELIYRAKEGHFLSDFTREVDRFIATEFAPD